MNKTEILDAISTIEINCWDFDHEYDNYQRGYAKTTKTIENENFTLVLEIEEEVRWERDGSSFEPVDKAIVGLTLFLQIKMVKFGLRQKIKQLILTHIKNYILILKRQLWTNFLTKRTK